MAVQARTLEIYAKLGIAGEAHERGRIGAGSNMWSGGRLRTRIPLEDMGKGISRFPYVLMLGQDDNERIMGRLLRRWGVEIQWNTELLGLEQSPASVLARIKKADGTVETITAAYVAGCDGGHSLVRQLNRIGFPGAPYEHTFFVADTQATGAMVPNELNVYLWRDGFHLYFPMPGSNRWRIIGILPPELRARTNVTFDDVIPSLRQETGTALSFRTCDWFSTYRIHHRCTERFRDRRCFLLGDAAHVHSPMGGQGMNTGLQDAYNLGWKLALVVSGRAGDALLDSYEAERMPVAQRLLATTDRAFQLLVSKTWLAGIYRTSIVTRIAALLMRMEGAKKVLFRGLSQTGISYRRSPLSRTLDGVSQKGPCAGDRFPWVQLRFASGMAAEDVFERLDDQKFNLIVVGQPAPDAYCFGLGDLLEVHSIAPAGENASVLAAAGIAARCYFLVRPDGHVGLAGTDLDVRAVKDWLAEAHVRTEDEVRADTVLSACG